MNLTLLLLAIFSGSASSDTGMPKKFKLLLGLDNLVSVQMDELSLTSLNRITVEPCQPGGLALYTYKGDPLTIQVGTTKYLVEEGALVDLVQSVEGCELKGEKIRSLGLFVRHPDMLKVGLSFYFDLQTGEVRVHRPGETWAVGELTEVY